MSAGVMKEKRQNSDRSVREIIASARSMHQQKTARVGALGAFAMSFLSGFLLWLCFTPVNASPMAWLAPVPLLLLVRIQERTSWMYAAIYIGSAVSQLAMLQWMRLGDPTMYFAWISLAAYLGLYQVAFVSLSRIAVHKWSVPLLAAGPVVWVGLEYLRAHLMTGFAWYFLGHSQYRWLELIQISDLVGAYGVSFIVIACATALALLVPHSWLIRCRLVLASTGPVTPAGLTLSQLVQVSLSLVMFISVLGYGYVRRSQADFKPGPRVALIQRNFLASLREEPVAPNDRYFAHMNLNAYVVKEQHPHLIVWPEGMFPWPLMSADKEMDEKELLKLVPSIDPGAWRNPMVAEMLREESERAGAALILGINSAVAKPKLVTQHNSAVFVRPDLGVAGRYDKMHLVPFGEYIPLRDVFPILKALTPYSDVSGLTPGSQPAIFEYKDWKFAPVICFEDTVPHLVRSIVASGVGADGKKSIDVLVNLSNDGWFHGSSELDQHLITAAFRAVECRTPLVRAVNTGVSAFIDGDGAIREPDHFYDGDARKNANNPPRTSSRDPKTGAWHKQLNAALIHTVPLDSRNSLYVRFGDWFAMLCAAAALFCSVSVLIPKPVSAA